MRSTKNLGLFEKNFLKNFKKMGRGGIPPDPLPPRPGKSAKTASSFFEKMFELFAVETANQ